MSFGQLQYDKLLKKAAALREKSRRARFAPSPTGPMHLGNARTALLAWLQARLTGSVFVMRMEDLDQPRVVEGSAEAIYEDLRWLGIDWDEGPEVGGPVGPYVQSARVAIYEAALERLKVPEDEQDECETPERCVFRCYCSRRDVREAASAPHEDGNLIYPGTCRCLSPAEERAVRREKPDRTPSWRFHAPSSEVCVDDEIAGEYRQQLDAEVGDFPVRRADGIFAYQLAVVVDDALMGVTDVLRGADLLSSAPRQIALFNALGLPVPRFWHVPLLCDECGMRLSKRDGAESIQLMREEGMGPQELVGQLAESVGLAEPGEVISARELLGRLDIRRFKRALMQESQARA